MELLQSNMERRAALTHDRSVFPRLSDLAMLLPAMFHFSYRLYDPGLSEHVHGISIGTSVILLIVKAIQLGGG